MSPELLAMLRAATQQPRMVTGPAAGDHHHCPQCGRGWFRPTRCGDCDRNTEQRTMVVEDLPCGVAARIDAPDLRQLLDEREALKKACEALARFADDGGLECGHIAPGPSVDCPLCLARAALSKAGGP